jgi:8-oxo-dGTP pyrophosphatase MutT (NUDIX family)
MKLNFDWKNDGKYHQYCIHCHAESVEKVVEDGKTCYFCATCKQRHERSIIIDLAIKWWITDDGEYWHESAGIFIRNSKGKFLFFERLMFPFAMTVPAGHVDSGEEPIEAAKREAEEEVGLTNGKPMLIVSEDIIGDSCRRGCDTHHWHVYLIALDQDIDLKVTEKEEGEKPIWLTLDEALQKDLTFPVRYIIERHKDDLTKTGI